MTVHSIVYIGLGSNLDNPHAQIDRAILALRNLPCINNIQCSYYYTSKAIGPGEQPDYVNAAVRCTTPLSPDDLLSQLQAIENKQGRQREIRWGARTLDLDLLLYDDRVIDNQRLQVPHPEIKNRNFVLYPLFDLNPELTFPAGDTLREAIANSSIDDLQRINSLESIAGESALNTSLPNEPLL